MNYVIFFVLSLLVSCQGIKFDPDPYVGDPSSMSIVNSEGIRVSCDDAKFSEFAAMHMSKWKELRAILRRARLPRSTQAKVMKSFTPPFLDYYLPNNDLTEESQLTLYED